MAIKEEQDALAKESGSPVRRVLDMNSLIEDGVQSLTNRAEKPRGRSLGFTGLDDTSGVLAPGKVCMLGGRPGIGKTAFALSVVLHVVGPDDPGAILYLSYELGPRAIGSRLLDMEIGTTDVLTWAQGSADPGLNERVNQSMLRLSRLPFHYLDGRDCTLDAALDEAYKLHVEATPLRLLIIDDLTEMFEERGPEHGAETTATVVRSLKSFAEFCRCPVLLLTSLDEKLDKRRDKTPRLYDLPDRDVLMAHINTVLFLHRSECYTSRPPVKGRAELILARTASDCVGVSYLFFDRERIRFIPWEDAPE